jgi:hypothetical protein
VPGGYPEALENCFSSAVSGDLITGSSSQESGASFSGFFFYPGCLEKAEKPISQIPPVPPYPRIRFVDFATFLHEKRPLP